jgi:hypothetical protein
MKSKLSFLGIERIGLAIGLILALALGVLVLFTYVAECATTRRVGIEPGEYAVTSGWGEANEAAMGAIQKVKIDRDERVAVFALADGSEISISFVPRDRADWPDGCPTNLLTHRMEVLNLEEDTLTIGPIALNKPILVRDCPRDPMRVVLREDGEIGGGGGACTWPSECIFFGPKRELSWQADDIMVSTSQDSPVTFDITASADEEYDRIDAGTFTVTHGPENGTAANNLELTGTITESTGFDGTGTFVIRIVDLVTYTPDASFRGTDTFTYRLCDMDGTCDTATVTVTINPETGSNITSFPRPTKWRVGSVSCSQR